MTSHRERVRPVKERVGSSARDGDGEGGTNDVYASRIFSSRLGRKQDFRNLQLMCYNDFRANKDFRNLQLMCYKLRKHEDRLEKSQQKDLE